jgi:hypothetical protein
LPWPFSSSLFLKARISASKPLHNPLNLNPTGQFFSEKACSPAPRQDSPLSIPYQRGGFDIRSSGAAIRQMRMSNPKPHWNL